MTRTARPLLSLAELPEGSANLYIPIIDGCEMGIGTPDELRLLAADGLYSDDTQFRLEWEAK